MNLTLAKRMNTKLKEAEDIKLNQRRKQKMNKTKFVVARFETI